VWKAFVKSSSLFLLLRKEHTQTDVMQKRSREDNTTDKKTDDDGRKEDEEQKDGEKRDESDGENRKGSKASMKRKRIKEDNENGRNHSIMKRKKGEQDDQEKEKEKEEEEGDDTDKTEAGVDGGEHQDGDDREVLTEQMEEEAIIEHSWRDTTEDHEQGSEGDDNEKLPTTPERAQKDYQNYRNRLAPPSIKQQRRDAIRKLKQATQYPTNYRGQQLFPPDFDQHVPLQPNTQTRKYRQLTAQTSEIRKDVREDSP